VLFGKRRTYQRKVAVAESDAVVSGDIYVFAPQDDRILPEILPFTFLSERYFQYAVKTSAGSLSPRTAGNILQSLSSTSRRSTSSAASRRCCGRWMRPIAKLQI